MPVPCRVVVTALAAATLLLCSAAVPAAGACRALPDQYVVARAPGVLPEGIDVRPDGTMYVSSDATGALYRGRVTAPELRPFHAEDATVRGSTRGIHSDRSGRVFSVGAGRLTVHAPDGHLLAAVDAPDGPLGPPDLNDLVITPDAVYVTDWANPVVLRAPLDGSHIGPLEPWADVRAAFPGFPDRYWLLNGIVADPAGRTLLVASNGTEAVWRIDTSTREVSRLDLGDTSFGADGMVLHGRHLYAVLNYGAPHGVYIARLDAQLRSGSVVHRITGDSFDLPTTLARRGCRLYVVNSQNDDPPGVPPYTVTAVHDPLCGAEG
ncbi:SMP-30/gluconolactonase/LRE family protein [Streptomyces sp. NPDC096205]|uniref:SMP-30/gluconolactonase/LRE family protein n=1 Tax=Streptomyces sp. NPDC096205 TaxID=3366081 RepID=UPI003810D894